MPWRFLKGEGPWLDPKFNMFFFQRRYAFLYWDSVTFQTGQKASRPSDPMTLLMVQKSQTTTWDGAGTLWIVGFSHHPWWCRILGPINSMSTKKILPAFASGSSPEGSDSIKNRFATWTQGMGWWELGQLGGGVGGKSWGDRGIRRIWWFAMCPVPFE